ncbi:hypothetical protein GCM10027443_37860 [Pontibacter brevis]
MTEELKNYESTLRKKHSFNWTPKFEEEFWTDLNKIVFVPIVVKTFEKLGWDLVFQDETSAEAKRKGAWNSWTEKISVIYEYGKVKVKSVSLGNEMWDNGRNSKRVKLFIYTFQQTEKEFDKAALAELEKEVEKTKNWDDYEIPESLPQPKERKEPQLWVPIVGGIIAALLLGFVVAFLSLKGIYIIGVFEVGIAFAIGFVLKYLIKASNYTNYSKLNFLMIGMVGIVYVSNQYFQYQIILIENNLQPIGFLEFIKLRLEAGLTIKSLNNGWIGLVISWIFQLGLTYAMGVLRLVSNLTSYQLERVPMEVVDFAFYHFVKEKTEDQVRTELSKMGWTEEQDQDEVFESIGAVQGATELNRME